MNKPIIIALSKGQEAHDNVEYMHPTSGKIDTRCGIWTIIAPEYQNGTVKDIAKYVVSDRSQLDKLNPAFTESEKMYAMQMLSLMSDDNKTYDFIPKIGFNYDAQKAFSMQSNYTDLLAHFNVLTIAGQGQFQGLELLLSENNGGGKK